MYDIALKSYITRVQGCYVMQDSIDAYVQVTKAVYKDLAR